MNKHTILVVEDEALIAANLVRTLSSLGYDVPEPVATGEDAIRAVKIKKPDLVLMDIQLIGEMNGIETAEKIRAVVDIPVVYLTAYADDLRLKQAKLTDPYGYLIKPVHSRELHATIEMALYKHALDKKLRASEERLRLTLDATNDGIWDWDIPTDTAFFSPRWYTILGYAPDEMPGTYATWKALIHPDDVLAAEQSIQNHLMRGEESYRVEFRMRTKDGDWKWILARGRVVTRDADCKPVRMLGTHTDISERKNTEAAFQTIIRSMVGTTGFNSLQKITENINSWLGAECVMVGEIQPDRQTVKVLSMLLDGKNITDFSYTLKGTPCDNVAEKGFCIYPDNVIGLFPDSKDLVDLNIRGYIGTPLRNSQGHVVGILCALFRNPVKASPAVQEIMNIIAVKAAAEIERKRAEEALRESEERFSNSFKYAAIGMALISLDGRWLKVNQSTCEIVGYSENELQAMTFQDITHPDDLDIDLEYVRQLVAGEIHTYQMEKRYFHKSGGLVWALLSVSLVRDKQGKPCYFISQIENITERKRAEKALRESEERYRAVADFTYDWEYWMGPDGKFVYVSPSCERITGYRPEEFMLDPNLLVTITHADDRDKIIEHFEIGQKQNTKHGVLEFRIITKNGKEVWIGHEGQPVYNTNRKYLGRRGSNRDITERKMAEEALHQANKKLTLLSSITRHDINNQLTVMIGYLTILKRKQADPVLNEYFVKVNTAAQRISSMIQFTKEYESIGVKAPAWQNCRTVADTAAKDAQPGQIMIQNDLPHNAEVFADPLVVKVFYNLIDNAIRYGGKITTIRFSVEEAGDEHRIVCEDDGDGVVAEEKEKIFERGFGKNTGLGLALSRQILSITGITIKETGEPGKGARFEMAVPDEAWRNT